MSVQATTWVWENSTANGNVRMVLLAIADAANREGEHACPSYDTIAQMCRISRSTVQRAVNWLRDQGEIEPTGVDPRYHTVIYRLSGMSENTVVSNGSRGGVNLTHPPGQMGLWGVSSETKTSVTGDTQPQKETPKETPPPLPPHGGNGRGARSSPPGWERWWALWPDKIAKKAALTAYQKAVKAHPPEFLYSALSDYLPRLEAQLSRGIHLHAATWLNGERWADEVAEPTQTIDGILDGEPW